MNQFNKCIMCKYELDAERAAIFATASSTDVILCSSCALAFELGRISINDLVRAANVTD